MKICYRCEQKKSYDNFWKMKQSKDGYNPSCKSCYKAEIINKTEEYRLENRNRVFKDSDTKKCCDCEIVKSHLDFYKNITSSDGLNSDCKICSNKRVGEYGKNHYSLNKDEISKNRKIKRQLEKMKKYGGELKDYENLMKSQLSLCAICREKKDLVVDHCHLCGLGKLEAVRGLLCHTCNTHSGFSLDDPDILLKARNYTLVHWDIYHKERNP